MISEIPHPLTFTVYRLMRGRMKVKPKWTCRWYFSIDLWRSVSSCSCVREEALCHRLPLSTRQYARPPLPPHRAYSTCLLSRPTALCFSPFSTHEMPWNCLSLSLSLSFSLCMTIMCTTVLKYKYVKIQLLLMWQIFNNINILHANHRIQINDIKYLYLYVKIY